MGSDSDSPDLPSGSTTATSIVSSSSSPPKVSLNTSPSNKTEEASLPANETRKRRSSAKAAASFLNNAKNTILGADKESPTTPIQKLSKTDVALSVPQGTLNNSAGESHQTANSSFTVGVTEDRNKKCRRTMEDTHSYLYNFLGTPGAGVPVESEGSTKPPADDPTAATEPATDGPQQLVETDNGYFAIFDGHAGTFAAEWCGKKLHVILEDLMRNNRQTPVPELLDQTFTSVDQQLEKLPLKNSGCTAIIAVLRWEDRVPNSQSATGSTTIAPATASAIRKSEAANADTPTQSGPATVGVDKASQMAQRMQEIASRQRVLYTANVGDARIVLCRNGKALRLSYDHKGSDEDEGRRISNAGGLILNNRVNGVLAVTRALGDAYLKDLVTGHPYTTETVIQPEVDEFLILACDGLWDVCSDQEAVDLIRGQSSPQTASKILVDHALSRFSTDNLSVMVVRFDSQKLYHNTNSTLGVEKDGRKSNGLGEVELIIDQAKQRSDGGDENGPSATESGSAALIDETDRQPDQTNQEPGPELRTEKSSSSDQVVVERIKEPADEK